MRDWPKNRRVICYKRKSDLCCASFNVSMMRDKPNLFVVMHVTTLQRNPIDFIN